MTCTPECRKPHGNQAHCGSCHQTFSTVANFDKHRTGDAEHRRCVDPEAISLRIGVDLIWRGEPGTWRPRAHAADPPQTAEPAPTGGIGYPEPAEAISGGVA